MRFFLSSLILGIILLPTSALAAVVSSGSGYQSSPSTTLSMSATVDADANLLVVAGTLIWNTTGSRTVTVTANGVEMDFVYQGNPLGGYRTPFSAYLINPPTGSYNIVITANTSIESGIAGAWAAYDDEVLSVFDTGDYTQTSTDTSITITNSIPEHFLNVGMLSSNNAATDGTNDTTLIVQSPAGNSYASIYDSTTDTIDVIVNTDSGNYATIMGVSFEVSSTTPPDPGGSCGDIDNPCYITQSGNIFVKETGNVVFGLALLIFLNSMMLWRQLNQSTKTYQQ